LDTFLWILQVILALVFLGFAYLHTFAFEQGVSSPRAAWMSAVGRQNMRIIGLLEFLAAIGLILPAITGVLPWLTPLAASMLVVLMVFAIAFHARRPGEVPNLLLNVLLGVLALILAYGRWVLEPFS
jgi:hypothetical protein